MLTTEQFKNPPIKEAIFSVSLKSPIPAEKIEEVCKSQYLTENFPNQKAIEKFELSNKNVDGEPKITTKHEKEGYTLRCASSSRNLLQILPTHLSYHNFDKYAGWDKMAEEFQNVWHEFCKVNPEVIVSRISVRFVNQLALPFPLKNGLAEYIKLLPQLPKELNSTIDNFFIQVNIPDDLGKLSGIITETVLPHGGKIDVLNFLIDITVLDQSEYNSNNESILETLKGMRAFKNHLFLSCITDQTKALFN